MTCKHLYMHAACNHPAVTLLAENGEMYYPLCEHDDLRECPNYEEKGSTNES